MPPSPAAKFSPRRESRGENHKRGRSLENGILVSDNKDDDLALFNEVQSRERDNFLLQSNDDFEDSFSTKLRYFSDQKLGISLPIRGESSDLLNADGDKNDYDWLLTPPETPLFSSLDDEAPAVNLAQRGRPRSQPISISRSSTMEKSYRSSRGSASPIRSSPSPRSGNSIFHSRVPSSTSAPNSSPTPSLRPSTPSRKPSPPPSKPSTPVSRSSTPTPRRLSTGSNGTGVRGVSPVKTGRGNSASPKIRAWQSNIPGFSLEAPPNLRTSLADRPASYVRGTSPASRNGRQSMSPTATRSINSSCSHERDRFSSHSKGSVVSSCDDDVESPQSISVGSLDRATVRRGGAIPSNRAMGISKKPARTLPSGSAPKRSFDVALRQMDQRKVPQSMFRPLLSSVPSSTFHAGKTSAAQHSLTSRASSITTSSNTSSDQGTSGVHDAEESEQNHEDLTSGYVKPPIPDVIDEVFVFDKADTLSEDIGHGIHDVSPNSLHRVLKGDPTLDSEALDVQGGFADCEGLKDMKFCSNCGRKIFIVEPIEGDLNLCPDCSRADIHPSVNSALVPVSSPTKNLEGHDSFDERDPVKAASYSSEVTSTGDQRGGHVEQSKETVKAGQNLYSEPIWNFLSENSNARPLVEDGDQRYSDESAPCNNGETGAQSVQNSKIDVSEGAGISVLLNRSSSVKGPVVQSRSFTASSIPYDNPSYVRESLNSMRSSLGHGSVSASSSLDLGSTRQTDARFQRQLSGRKSDLENSSYDISTKHRRTVSSSSNPGSQGLATSAHKEDKDVNVICLVNQDQRLDSENTLVDITGVDVESTYMDRTMTASTSELCSNFDEPVTYENGEDFTNNTRDVEASVVDLESSSILEEDAMLNSCVDGVDIVEVPPHISLDTISEIETENAHQGSPDSGSGTSSSNSKSSIDELREIPVLDSSDKHITVLVPDSDNSGHASDILEEPTVAGKAKGAPLVRNMTLEEATDTILFCNSIIHNLAYDAATIAMEKENTAPWEGSKPMVTILGGKDNSDKREPRSRTSGKRLKSPKARKRRVETPEAKSPTNNSDQKSDAPSNTRIVGYPRNDDSTKPPKLESKCNCTVM